MAPGSGRCGCHVRVHRQATDERSLECNHDQSLLYALTDLCVDKNLVVIDELKMYNQRIRDALARQGEAVSAGVVMRIDPAEPPKEPEIDCKARLPVCKAACCSLSFPLSAEEIESGQVKWELGRPYCVEHPDLAPVATGPSPILKLTDDKATIAGFACRKAIYNNLTRTLEVYFTETVHAEDATGAVHRIDGVPGLIVRWQAIEELHSGLVERVTVVDTSFARPPATLFAPPAGFRKMASVDEARAEERRLLDAEAARHPATAEERARFVGRWDLATAPDDLHVEIIADGASYLLRTTHNGNTSDERATMKGRALLVEDPPNFRLYRVSDDGDQLVLVGSEAFRFHRVR